MRTELNLAGRSLLLFYSVTTILASSFAAAMTDEAARRALLLDSGTSEAVTVNQRALIDKILAR